MGPPPLPEQPRKRKKKGRPSLIELQKRSLRLEKQQLQEARTEKGVSDEDEAQEGSRKEKKLKFVMRLPDSDGGGDGRQRQRLDGTPGREKALKATTGGASEAPMQRDPGPGATPLPEKKLLVFILDRLQKKDTYGVYAEPVDPEDLPDYHDIIKHPMDFATIRTKLENGAYANLEEFEDDVFLICSNAMCYNSPDTIYYRQARAIQELATKSFEDLRQDSEDSESEDEPKPRRGRPPIKNLIRQTVRRPTADRATTDFSSGSTLASAAISGRLSYTGLDVPHGGSQGPLGLKSIETNRFDDHRESKSEDFTGTKGAAAKHAKRIIIIDENRRNTYSEPHSSNSLYDAPVLSTFDGLRKLLIPVGLQMQHLYPRSLARFAAKLGPVAWGIAAKQIERSLPQGTKFGRGWVVESEAPLPTHSPLYGESVQLASGSHGTTVGEKPLKRIKMEDGGANTVLMQAASALPHGDASGGASSHHGHLGMQHTMNGFMSPAGHSVPSQIANMRSNTTLGPESHMMHTDSQTCQAADSQPVAQSMSQVHRPQDQEHPKVAAFPAPKDESAGFQPLKSPGNSCVQHPDLVLQL